MVADIQIHRYTGVAQAGDTNITSINTRANAADQHYTTETTNPITIVTGETHRSYWVVTRLVAATTPTGTVDNIRWYTNGGSFGTGVTCRVGTATGYTQATGVTGDGTELTTGNYPTWALGNADALATYLEGSPLAVSGSISNPSTGQFGDFVVYQIVVADTASAGNTSQRTFTWKYDET